MHYDPEAMLGILALEAYRAGAVVIGEDLGTVLPEVTEGLERMNMLGSAVLWFTRDYDDPDERLPARRARTPATRWPASPPTTCRPRPVSWPASRSGSAPAGPARRHGRGRGAQRRRRTAPGCSPRCATRA